MTLPVDHILREGAEAQKAGRLNEADRLYRSALQDEPGNPEAHYRLGTLAVQTGNPEAALPLFKTAIEHRPQEVAFWRAMIDALIRAGHPADAAMVAQRSRDIGLQDEEIDRLADGVTVDNRPLDPAQGDSAAPPEQMQRIINLFNQGRLAEVVDRAQDLIKRYPEDVMLHNIQGGANAGLHRLDSAIASYDRALEIDPEFGEAHYNRASALREKGNLPAAVKSLRRAVQCKPDSVEARNNLGITLQEVGEPVAAIESFERVLELAPGFAEAHNNLGIALKETGETEQAVQSFNRALRIRPDFAEAHNNLGLALQETGDLKSAVESYRNALDINPDFAEALCSLGSALKDSGDLWGAIEYLERAASVDPDVDEVHYNLGRCYQAARRFEDALRHFQLTDYMDSRSFELDCLYLLGEKERFLEKNRELCEKNVRNPLMGCLGCHSAVRYQRPVPNSFCSEPLRYIHKTSLIGEQHILDQFIEAIPHFKSGLRGQPLLENGHQTAGNILAADHPAAARIEALIRSKVEDYRKVFADSTEPFLREWPPSYTIHGWLVVMQRDGFLRSHIHESGWVSGTIYMKVPKDLEGDEGCISFSTHGGIYPHEGKTFPEKLITVEQGEINLFPSSLFHHTIPFKSDGERLSLAFDILPG